MKTLLLKPICLLLLFIIGLGCSKKEDTPETENLIKGQWKLTKLVVNGEEVPNECPIPWKYNFNDEVVSIAITSSVVNNCNPSTIQYRYTLEENRLTFKSSNIITETNTVNTLTSQELVYTKENGNVLYLSKVE